jgi:predicted DNA-binding transcriptional regulator YafY
MFNQHRLYRVFQLINHLRSGAHKEIEVLSRFMETSTRSTYRYIELLKAIGFQIRRDKHGRPYLPSSKRYEIIPLTDDELALLRRQLQALGSDSPLAASVMQKIGQFSDASFRLQDLRNLKLAQHMELINTAMTHKWLRGSG